MASLIINPRARVFHGHDWVYATEVGKAIGSPIDGEVVTLKDRRGRILGSAIYNTKSQIVARRFSRQQQKLDLDFFVRRITQAIEYRQRSAVNPEVCRLVWSESDGLPGLIVDRYGSAVVVQMLTLAMDLHKAEIVKAIEQVVAPTIIIERNDAPVRRAEGMELVTGVLAGDGSSSRSVEINGLSFELDLLHGQKTGFYLDQVAAYPAVANYAKGRKVLDCFANQGAFALSCARAGASSVTAVEISEAQVQLADANATRNHLEVDFYAANAFDFLKQADQNEDRYDLIVLDPPSFTRSKGKSKDALRGYKEIHVRALKLLNKNGVLATFSCSHHISETMFLQTVVDASVDAHRATRLLQRLGQAADHPVLPHIPETEYLKGFILETIPGR